MNLNERKVSEFESDKVKIMDDFINLNKSKFKNKDLFFAGKLKK
jgi:acyl-CoA thioester hydrolase